MLNDTAATAGGRMTPTVSATISDVRATRGIEKRRSRLTPEITAAEISRQRNGSIGMM